ncbi:MAG: type II secretion system protein GspL [Panacagrimonas sp.]
MRETLYIRLGAAPDADVEFGVAPAEFHTLGTRRGPLGEALKLGAGRRLIVLVPGADVRLSAARVPAKQAAKVLQALPYVLEDQVADDIETLHFAIGPRQDDGSHPVAIVSRARMEQWLAPFRAQLLRPELLVPDTLALAAPAGETQWSALAETDPAGSEQVLVRNGPWSGFSCAAEDLAPYLTIADPEKAGTLKLSVTGDNRADWSRFEWPVVLMPGHRTGLSALAAQLRPEQSINLLQGSYAQSRDLDRLWKPWRMAAGLALLWIAVAVTRFSIDTARLSSELARQDEANVARFQQLFPDQTRVVDLSAQLDQQLRALAGGAGAGGPLALLEVLTQSLQASPGLKITGMQFREGALFLSMTASDLQMLEKLQNWHAGQTGTRFDVQSANAEAEGVQIRARLSPT